MGDADYLYAFQSIIMPIAYEFAPDMVMSTRRGIGERTALMHVQSRRASTRRGATILEGAT